MNFLGFYFNKPLIPKSKGKCGIIPIKENEFDNLVEEFRKDYKYILEIEEFKNHWGYGYKYILEDSHIILLNKFKDEIDNDEALIYFDNENSFIGIQETYKIDKTNVRYNLLEEI